MCVFIDGLDEFSGDQDALVTMVEKVHTVDVKVCLSSRPYRSYSEAFSSSAMLRLQDLTEPDTELYVSDKLRASLLQTSPEKEVSKILYTIVKKAQGVFLWVELAVQQLMTGLKNEDDLGQLKRRLQLMPSDIEKMYAHMLSNIDQVYREEAALLLHMALNGLTGSILNVTLALNRVFDQIPELSVEHAISLCNSAKRRIPTICAGLLEVHEKDYRTERESLAPYSYFLSTIEYVHPWAFADVSFYDNRTRVGFLHRTAVEFFQQSEPGKQFLEGNSPSDLNHFASYFRALLANVRLFGFTKIAAHGRSEDEIAQEFVYEIMHKVFLAEQQTETAQVSLCDEVDRTMAVVDQRRTLSSPKSHWCARWGFWPWWSDDDDETSFTLSVPSTISRSSSADSFHSASSEAIIHHTPGTQSNKPVDFLGLAALWGLSRYVCRVLNSQQAS